MGDYPLWEPFQPLPPSWPPPLSCPECTCASRFNSRDYLVIAAAVIPAFLLGVLYSRILRCVENLGKASGRRPTTVSSTQSVAPRRPFDAPGVSTATDLELNSRSPVLGAFSPTLSPVIGAPLPPITPLSPIPASPTAVLGTPVLTPVASEADPWLDLDARPAFHDSPAVSAASPVGALTAAAEEAAASAPVEAAHAAPPAQYSMPTVQAEV